jgi:hypothetical protein
MRQARIATTVSANAAATAPPAAQYPAVSIAAPPSATGMTGMRMSLVRMALSSSLSATARAAPM